MTMSEKRFLPKDQRGCDAVRPRAGVKDEVLWSAELPGFGMRVRASGHRTWVYQFVLGKEQRMTLDGCATMTLAEAKQEYNVAHAKVRLGKDPRAEVREARKAAASLVRDFVPLHIAQKEREVGRRQYQKITYNLSARVWGCIYDKPLAAVTVDEVRAHLATLAAERGAFASDEALKALRCFFGWCVTEQHCAANPVVDPGLKTERDRKLSKEETVQFWRESGDDDYGAICKLLLLTGCRRDAIGGLRWSEVHDLERPIDLANIDADSAQIVLPPGRTKGKKEHVVPLCEQARQILLRLRALRSDPTRDLVFGSSHVGYRNWAYSKRRFTIAGDWHLHDIRRTFASLCREMRFADAMVIDVALEHAWGSRVSRIYQHDICLADRKELHTKWGNWLQSRLDGNVVPLIRAA